MAKNSPVIIWIIKHKPNKEPKFHHALMLEGEGRSIKELLTIFIIGDICLICFFIKIFVVEHHNLRW